MCPQPRVKSQLDGTSGDCLALVDLKTVNSTVVCTALWTVGVGWKQCTEFYNRFEVLLFSAFSMFIS